MNLKKSDKIIAVVGVVILIVAAVGIILYATMDEDEEPDDDKKLMDYSVEWIPGDGQLTIEEFVDAKEEYENQFSVDVIEPGAVLTDVKVQISWEDGHKTDISLKKRNGEDTLKAEIGLSGEEPKTHEETGSGNETFEFILNDKPMDKILEEIENYEDAREKVMTEYNDMNSADFNVKVDVEKGERPLRLRLKKIFHFFADKGEDFELLVTYNYYYPEITEIGPSDEDNNDDGNEMGQLNLDDKTWSSQLSVMSMR